MLLQINAGGYSTVCVADAFHSSPYSFITAPLQRLFHSTLNGRRVNIAFNFRALCFRLSFCAFLFIPIYLLELLCIRAVINRCSGIWILPFAAAFRSSIKREPAEFTPSLLVRPLLRPLLPRFVRRRRM